MKVLITGGRNWTDREAIRSWLAKLQDWGYDTIIEGEAKGADSMARQEGEALGFTVLPFPADWQRYGRAAGVIRNQQMLDEGKPDLVVWFHHNLAESKGTRDMVNRAIKANITILSGIL